MDFRVSRLSYYADFFVGPLLALAATAMVTPAKDLVYTVPFGIALWTLAEYWIHRVIFHRVFRRAHDLHHKRPKGFDAAPSWLTAIIHLTLLGSARLFGQIGLGIFIGVEIGYFSYIFIHDKIHHGGKLKGWWLHRARLHGLHHGGVEANFGLSTHVWDHVFRTFRGVDFAAKRG